MKIRNDIKLGDGATWNDALWALTLPWDRTKFAGVFWFPGDRPASCAGTIAVFGTRQEARDANKHRNLRPVRVEVTVKAI